MTVHNRLRWVVLASALAVLAATFGGLASAAPQGPAHSYIVVVKNGADYDAIRAKAATVGARVLSDLRPVNMMVVSATAAARSTLAADSRLKGIAADRIERIAPVETSKANLKAPGLLSAHKLDLSAMPRTPVAPRGGFTPDPSFSYNGLMWSIERINAPQAWEVSTGDPAVRVGVADTGLDFTHYDLKANVAQVVDFTAFDDPPLCKTFFGLDDRDFAHAVGGPVKGDWHGHGSWIGGNIAGVANGLGVNGIAPHITLVSLKISQWCGSAYDSTLLNSFMYAAQHNIDIVSISFGGYLDRSDPEQDLIWQQYVDVVQYAKRHGTAIVAAAGNEHTQIGPEGLVLTHGTLTSPGGELFDAFGQYEVPGGIPGVVDVSSTGNVVVPTSPHCPPGSMGSETDLAATCKPKADPHQPFGMGKQDQLAYYSNYGSRIDVAGPGGARKFGGVPAADRGGTPGFPYTDADLTTVFEDFSITSNYATGIPCFTFTQGSGFPQGQCYSSIQGTSMATPHASAVLALIASAMPELRGHVDDLVAVMKGGARAAHNYVPGLSATDTSPGDLLSSDCTTGYCHLGGAVVSDAEAYGAGIVDASVIVK